MGSLGHVQCSISFLCFPKEILRISYCILHALKAGNLPLFFKILVNLMEMMH